MLSFLSKRQIWVVLDWNSLQVLSLLYINDITDICFFNFAISADNTNFYSKSDQTFDL